MKSTVCGWSSIKLLFSLFSFLPRQWCIFDNVWHWRLLHLNFFARKANCSTVRLTIDKFRSISGEECNYECTAVGSLAHFGCKFQTHAVPAVIPMVEQSVLSPGPANLQLKQRYHSLCWHTRRERERGICSHKFRVVAISRQAAVTRLMFHAHDCKTHSHKTPSCRSAERPYHRVSH